MGNGDSEPQKASENIEESSTYFVVDLANKLKKEKLLIEKDGKSQLDLGVFNRNLKNASENLGQIVPSIIEVSKEQVALINHGLEGTLNFIKAFQTFNTAFAVFAEKPEIFEKYESRLNDLEDLENTLIKEVGESLEGLNEMLTETFKEVSVYYTALAHIIYSEKEGGTIEFGYKRKSSLDKKMSEIYERKDVARKQGFKMEKSFGLVQIIESLVNVSKEVKKIEGKDLENYKEMIEGSKGEQIKINVDIIKSLESISNELLSSLKKSGILIEEQGEKLKIIEQEALEQQFFSQSGKEAVDNIKKTLENHSRVSLFLRRNFNELSTLERYQNEIKKNQLEKAKEKYELFKRMSSIKDENKKIKKEHDLIIKNQLNLIIDVVNSFASIISLWGDQVDNEISIAQVADKAVMALEQLRKVEIKADIEADDLLVAKETQKSIKETAEKAKDFKNLGKAMQMLLKRVKTLLSYNKGLEAQIKMFHSEQSEAEKYKNENLKKISQVLNEKFPKSSKNVSKTIDKFIEAIDRLAEKENKKQNEKLIINLIKSYERISNSVKTTKKHIINEAIRIDSDILQFEKSCKFLGEIINLQDDSVDSIFDSFKGLRETFKDDFEIYENLSKDYHDLIKGLAPFLDLMSYTISMQKQLGQKKIELKTINISLKAFTLLFDEMKKMQVQEESFNKDLTKMIKELKLDKDYYKEYKEKLGKSNELLEELEKIVKNYFIENERKTKKAYELANDWMNSFEINFKDYNKKLKGASIGFFEKLFKTQSYKEKDFWQDISEIKKSFSEIDKKIGLLGNKNLKVPKDVEQFCKFTTEFVNEIFEGYKQLIIEVNRIVQVMHLVNVNLSKFNSEKIGSFSKLIDSLKEFNIKLNDLEAKTVDLEEYERINVNKIEKSLEKLPDFSKLKLDSEKKLNQLNEIKIKVIQDVEDIRNYLLVYYTTYLVQVLPKGSEEEETYGDILMESSKKAGIDISKTLKNVMKRK